MLDILGRQVASPVQFVTGLHTLYDAGARVFVEVGPKKALHGFVEDVLGDARRRLALFTNHPKIGDVASFNQALCGLYAAGLGLGRASPRRRPPSAARAAAPGAAERAIDLRPQRPAAASHRHHDLADRTWRSAGCSPASSSAAAQVTGAAAGRTRPQPSRSSSPAPRSGCPAWSGSSTTTTSPASSTASSSSTSIPHRFRAGDGRQAHHPAGQAGVGRPDVRDDRRRGRRHQAGRPARAAGHGRGVRRRAERATPRSTT